ncbi:MAG: hypothetical protein LH629_00635, partial [Ignavibacteria bacterium]|nr:hypothetical protein [Ignavibacteria bacterium]
MNKLKYAILMLLISTSVYSQNVKITDFDLPVSSARKFTLNGFYNWGQTDPYDSTAALSNSSSWNLGGQFTTFYSSPAYAWNVAVDGSLFQL